MRWSILALLAIGLLAAPVHADDTNPLYASWAKFKVGASSTVSNDTVASGKTINQTTTTKLTSLTPDKATLEITMTMNVAGRSMTLPPQTQEIPAKGEPAVGSSMRPGMAGATTMMPPVDDSAAKDVKTGTEDVKVGDKTVKTNWTEATSTTKDGSTVHYKVWRSTDVPGGMVKMTSEMTGKHAATVNMTLTDFNAGG
jgi:hypothetical protein